MSSEAIQDLSVITDGITDLKLVLKTQEINKDVYKRQVQLYVK